MRIAAEFGKLGIEAGFEPVFVSAHPCARHPRLGADRICPRCGSSYLCTLCAEVEDFRACAKCSGSERRRRRFRNLRVVVLLGILALVLSSTLSENRRLTSWSQPLQVGIYPVMLDSSPAVAERLRELNADQFQPIANFVAQQAQRYGLPLRRPILLHVGRPAAARPPEPPRQEPHWSRIALFSLELRYWAWSTIREHELPRADVRLFIAYQDAAPGQRLPHSLGLWEGHLGIVNAYADPKMAHLNHITIAHELMHALGASDKYDAELRPLHPDGYAEPDRRPRHPQRAAEIMAGRIPLSADALKDPDGFEEVVIGLGTAREIGWVP